MAVRHDEEVQHGVDEVAQHQRAASGQLECQRREGFMPAGENAQNGIEDIIDQGGGDGTEGAADDDAYGQIQYIAPGNKGFEFGKKAGRS